MKKKDIEIKNKKAIICDIDGCLLNTDKIFEDIEEKGLKSEEKWQYFHKNANNPAYSIKNKQLFCLLNKFEDLGYTIIILTARCNSIAYETGNYLTNGEIKLNHFPYYMGRIIGDYRPSDVIKQENLEEIIGKNLFDIEFAIDDELKNWQMFQRMGIPSFRYKINVEDDYDTKGFEDELHSN